VTSRLRPAYVTWPRPALVLADTPRPGCADCGGRGGFQAGHPGAEEPDEVACDCWDPTRSWLLLPVPRWLARRWLGYRAPEFSTESPF
jgi:hypothetical protein